MIKYPFLKQERLMILSMGKKVQEIDYKDNWKQGSPDINLKQRTY